MNPQDQGLECHAGPIGDLFLGGGVPGIAGSEFLEPQQIDEFHRSGFLEGIDVLTAPQVEALLARLTSIGENLESHGELLHEVEAAWLARPDEVVLHFLGAWRIDELFHDLVFHRSATVPCAQLLDTPRLRFWHDQVFWKPPRHPGVVPWHQDYSYWTRTGPPAHITLFIALDDMGPENGGLEYVPGSHRWPLLPLQDFGGDLDAVRDHLTPDQAAEFRPHALHLRAGQASIHHSHLVHGSRGNPSDRPRRAIVLNYMADGTRVLDGERPLLEGVEPLPTGARVDGPMFPIALDRTGEPDGKRTPLDPKGSEH